MRPLVLLFGIVIVVLSFFYGYQHFTTHSVRLFVTGFTVGYILLALVVLYDNVYFVRKK